MFQSTDIGVTARKSHANIASDYAPRSPEARVTFTVCGPRTDACIRIAAHSDILEQYDSGNAKNIGGGASQSFAIARIHTRVEDWIA